MLVRKTCQPQVCGGRGQRFVQAPACRGLPAASCTPRTCQVVRFSRFARITRRDGGEQPRCRVSQLAARSDSAAPGTTQGLLHQSEHHKHAETRACPLLGGRLMHVADTSLPQASLEAHGCYPRQHDRCRWWRPSRLRGRSSTILERCLQRCIWQAAR